MDSINTPAGAGTTPGETGVLCRLVARLGHAGFMEEVAREYAALTGAVQVTTFVVEPRRVRCALAYRPRAPRLVETLCRSYVRGHYAEDPVLKPHLPGSGPPGDAVERYVLSAEGYDEPYRGRFFAAADLTGKMSLIAHRGDRVVYVNFYFRGNHPDGPPDLDGAVLAELLHKHDALTGGWFGAGTGRARMEAYLAERFPALSPREVQVCARIACGLPAAAIAADLAVREETVATFRKRAYAKLGIASRGELFAQCAGLTS